MNFGEPFGGIVPGARGSALATLLRTGTPLSGRQVHAIVGDRHSLGAIQQALRDLEQLGLVTTETVGRSRVHSVNEHHAAVPPLRSLLDPIALLTQVVSDSAGSDVDSVIVFGSIARGEAGPTSDVDLVVVAPASWDRRVEVEDAVRDRLGNSCDVLHLTPANLKAPKGRREPVVTEILRDGVAIIGTMPRTPTGARP